MAIGQKYIKITEWLTNCGKSKVHITFQQLNEISKLPPSAYVARPLWTNSGQSFSSSWLSANYKVTAISMPQQWVEFTLQPVPNPQVKAELAYIKPTNHKCKPDRQLLKELIECGHICIDTIQEDCNHRYHSWEYCYKAFSEIGDFSKERIDYLSLHLAWYLGSWGMFRNSFLQNKDYKIHIPIVEILIDSKWEKLRGLLAEEFVKSDSLDMIINLADNISNCYKKYAGGVPTDTLLTKIILGTIGYVPAYDRFFIYSLRKTGIASGTFCKKSLFQLGKFYLEYSDDWETFQLSCPSEIINYPPAKVLDICFFEYGVKHSRNDEK